MNGYRWYAQLKKPSWAPPSWLFRPVWTVLYCMIALSFGTVFYRAFQGQLPIFVVIPFLLNLVFNFIFTPIQFGARNNSLAAIDILLTLLTLIWLTCAIYPYISWISFLQIPYLLWVSFATILQLTVTFLNKK